jgi:hypothetical protein
MSTVTPIHLDATPLPPAVERATGALTVGRMVLLAAGRGRTSRCATPVLGRQRRSRMQGWRADAGRSRVGLIALGLGSGETVSILSSTRVEWTLCAGAVVAPPTACSFSTAPGCAEPGGRRVSW